MALMELMPTVGFASTALIHVEEVLKSSTPIGTIGRMACFARTASRCLLIDDEVEEEHSLD